MNRTKPQTHTGAHTCSVSPVVRSTDNRLAPNVAVVGDKVLNKGMKVDGGTVPLCVGVKVLDSAGVSETRDASFDSRRVVVPASFGVVVQPKTREKIYMYMCMYVKSNHASVINFGEGFSTKDVIYKVEIPEEVSGTNRDLNPVPFTF